MCLGWDSHTSAGFVYTGAYPGITRLEGISEAVHAALLQDGYSYKFIAGRQQEECDCC